MFRIRYSTYLPAFFLLSLWFLACRNNTSASKSQAVLPEFSEETVTIPPANTLGVLIHKKGASAGYSLFSIYKDTYLIDHCGRVVNHWKSKHESGGYYELLPDGSLLRAGKIENDSIDYPGIGGIIEKFDWEGQQTWHYIISSPQYSQHHGLRQLPNGNIIFTAVFRKTKEEAITAGRDPENLPDDELYDEQLIEIKPSGTSGGTVIWEWHAWDHLVQDKNADADNYGTISDNPGKLDINFLGISDGDKDWLHFNSLAYNEERDQLLIGSQKLSEIYIIDHSTTTREAAGETGGNSGKGGALIYRWGNPAAYGPGDAASRTLFGQHFAHWIPGSMEDGGKILIYNNGLGRTPGYSSVDIIAPELLGSYNYVYSSSEGYSPSKAGWRYVNEADSTAFFSKIMSSAQRLSNGNTFVCEGTKGRLFEVAPSGEVVWEYRSPETTNGTILPQGEQPSSHIFMALHYDPDFPGLKDRELSPGMPIEINFNIGNCR